METNISLLVFSTPIPLFRRRQKGEMDYLRPLVSVNFQLCPLMDREQEEETEEKVSLFKRLDDVGGFKNLRFRWSST